MSSEPAGFPLPLVVARWHRFGHDRAYVKADDLDLGFRNLITGEVCCDDPTHRDVVDRATTDLYARVSAARAAAEYRPRHSRDDDDGPVDEEAASALLPDRDLALNRPGEAARLHSRQLLAQAPVRLLIARAVGVKTEERNWHVGAEGETRTGRQLARLEPRWRTLHAVPVGDKGADIDHVLIGPGGVFTINSKNHPQASVWVRGDTIKLNGATVSYVRNSRHEAQRAATLLSAAARLDVEVRALIVIVGAERGYSVKAQPEDGVVTVLREQDLIRYLATLPPALDGPAVDHIYAVARHLATWQPKTVGRQDFAQSC